MLHRLCWRIGSIIVLSCFMFVLAGCPGPSADSPDPDTIVTNYDTQPVAITNPDWTILPLPNNLMNPAAQARIGVMVVGDTPLDAETDTLQVPIIDAVEANRSQDLGYELDMDSDLTVDLKTSMNELDGYVPNFVPEIPFSKLVDMDSIVRYSEKSEQSNPEEANFFLLDITDPEQPVAIDPDSYYLLFNIDLRESYPYNMTIRFKPVDSLMPELFDSGHSYLVVMTGLNEKGIKDVDGQAFLPDAPFLLFAAEDEQAYIAADGSPRNNLFTDVEYIQELENARQTTNYGLKIWEGLFSEMGRSRNEVISAFHFSIATNPLAQTVNPERIVFSKNPMLPPYSLGYRYNCKGEVLPVCQQAETDFKPSFETNQPLDEASATEESLGLFLFEEDGSLTRVESVTASVDNLEDTATVTLTPSAGLKENATYLVAANTKLQGTNGRCANADVYFGMVRSDQALIAGDQWLSPFIDSRVDTLIGAGRAEKLNEKNLSEATDMLISILSMLERLRVYYQAPIDALIQTGFIESRIELAVMYTFTTSECEPVSDEECQLGENDLGEKNLVEADITGNWDMAASFNDPLNPDTPMELSLVGILEQQGVILDGNAFIDGELFLNGDSSHSGVSPVEPGAIATDGTFTITLNDFPIPSTISTLLLDDTVADVVLHGTIYNSDGIAGSADANVKGANIEGVGVVENMPMSGVFYGRRRGW